MWYWMEPNWRRKRPKVWLPKVTHAAKPSKRKKMKRLRLLYGNTKLFKSALLKYRALRKRRKLQRQYAPYLRTYQNKKVFIKKIKKKSKIKKFRRRKRVYKRLFKAKRRRLNKLFKRRWLFRLIVRDLYGLSNQQYKKNLLSLNRLHLSPWVRLNWETSWAGRYHYLRQFRQKIDRRWLSEKFPKKKYARGRIKLSAYTFSHCLSYFRWRLRKRLIWFLRRFFLQKRRVGWRERVLPSTAMAWTNKYIRRTKRRRFKYWIGDFWSWMREKRARLLLKLIVFKKRNRLKNHRWKSWLQGRLHDPIISSANGVAWENGSYAQRFSSTGFIGARKRRFKRLFKRRLRKKRMRRIAMRIFKQKVVQRVAQNYFDTERLLPLDFYRKSHQYTQQSVFDWGYPTGTAVKRLKYQNRRLNRRTKRRRKSIRRRKNSSQLNTVKNHFFKFNLRKNNFLFFLLLEMQVLMVTLRMQLIPNLALVKKLCFYGLVFVENKPIWNPFWLVSINDCVQVPILLHLKFNCFALIPSTKVWLLSMYLVNFKTASGIYYDYPQFYVFFRPFKRFLKVYNSTVLWNKSYYSYWLKNYSIFKLSRVKYLT